MLSVKNILADSFHLFFPHHCLGCGSDILPLDSLLCLNCLHQLPHTGFETKVGNPVEQIFRGRMDLRAASCQFYFSKGQVVQQMIHQLKYKANKEAGEWMGEVMGSSLLSSGRFCNLDYLIPLPLYPDKEFKRGYNQAEVICRGLSRIMNVPILTKNLIRQRSTSTQTKKHRAERWENVEGSFAVKAAGKLQGKNLLLVDDVITTGATLEAAGQCLLKIPGVQLSLVTLAMGGK